MKKFESVLRNPDICLYPPPLPVMIQVQPASDDIYSGPSLLRFSASPSEMHPELPRPNRTRRIPSSEVRYNKPFSPPMTDDIVDTKHTSPGTLVGRRVAKRFHDGIYIGTVTDAWIDEDHVHYWTVTYDDHDFEDLNFVDIHESLALLDICLEAYRFPGVPAVDLPPAPSNDNKDTSLSGSPACPDKLFSPNRGASFPVHSEDRGDKVAPKNVPDDGGISNSRIFPPVPAKDEFHDCRQSSSPPTFSPPRTRSRARRALAQLGIVYLTSTATLASPFPSLQPTAPRVVLPPDIHKVFPFPVDPLPPDISPVDHSEELRAYHAHLDRLNDMFHPDPERNLWTPTTVLSHTVRTNPKTQQRQVYLKVQWPDEEVPRQSLSVDTLRLSDPWLCIRYAYQNKLLNKIGWDWVPAYLASDKSFTRMVQAFLPCLRPQGPKI